MQIQIIWIKFNLQNVANISAGSKASMAVTFDGNVYSFGQNNSFEINLENYNSSQKNFLNSNRSLDPLSLTFHEQTINTEGGE